MTMLAELQVRLAQIAAAPLTAILLTGLALLGASVVVRSALATLRAAWVHFLRPGRDLRKLGDWAVVTGATDGIGKAYADALAKRGVCHPSVPIFVPRLSPVTSVTDGIGRECAEAVGMVGSLTLSLSYFDLCSL